MKNLAYIKEALNPIFNMGMVILRGASPAETSSILRRWENLSLNEVEKAYIAGIVDGEGTIGLWRHHKNETASPMVTIANNSLDLLQWIQSKVGGNICSKKKRQAHHGDSYALSLKQDRAICFLNEIKSYLIIKKQQAELITGEYKTVTHRAGKYTPEMLVKKEALVAKIRKLNQRQISVFHNTPGSLAVEVKGEEIVHAIQK